MLGLGLGTLGAGLGLGSSYTSYTIETEVFGPTAESNGRSSGSNASIAKYTMERRHKEFQVLYYQLQSMFPFCIIPSLPTIARTPLSLHKPNTHDVGDEVAFIEGANEDGEKEEEEGSVDTDFNPSIASQLFSDGQDGADTDYQKNRTTSRNKSRSKSMDKSHRVASDAYDLKVNKRRRRLQLWIQYIASNSFLLENSSHLAEFLSGQPSLIPSGKTSSLNRKASSVIATSVSTDQSQSSTFLGSLQSHLAQFLTSPTKVLDLLSGKQRILQAYLHSEHEYVNNRDSLALQLYSQLYHTYLNRMIASRKRHTQGRHSHSHSNTEEASNAYAGRDRANSYRSFEDDDDEDEYAEAASIASTSPEKASSLAALQSRAVEAIGAIGALGSNAWHGSTDTDGKYDTEYLSRPRVPHVLSESRSALLLQLVSRRMRFIEWYAYDHTL